VKRKCLERFYVTPIDGVQFSGVLLDKDGSYAMFGDVKAHPASGVVESIPGPLYIREDNIAYMQLVPADATC
jgi:hypothetical protein